MHTLRWTRSCRSKIETVTVQSSVILLYKALSVSASLSDTMVSAVAGHARRSRSFSSTSFLGGMASCWNPIVNRSVEKGSERVSAGKKNALSAKSRHSILTQKQSHRHGSVGILERRSYSFRQLNGTK